MQIAAHSRIRSFTPIQTKCSSSRCVVLAQNIFLWKRCTYCDCCRIKINSALCSSISNRTLKFSAVQNLFGVQGMFFHSFHHWADKISFLCTMGNFISVRLSFEWRSCLNCTRKLSVRKFCHLVLTTNFSDYCCIPSVLGTIEVVLLRLLSVLAMIESSNNSRLIVWSFCLTTLRNLKVCPNKHPAQICVCSSYTFHLVSGWKLERMHFAFFFHLIFFMFLELTLS